jgi:hypothetical protein
MHTANVPPPREGSEGRILSGRSLGVPQVRDNMLLEVRLTQAGVVRRPRVLNSVSSNIEGLLNTFSLNLKGLLNAFQDCARGFLHIRSKRRSRLDAASIWDPTPTPRLCFRSELGTLCFCTYPALPYLGPCVFAHILLLGSTPCPGT